MTSVIRKDQPTQSLHVISSDISTISKAAKGTHSYPPRWFVFLRDCFWCAVIGVTILSIEPLMNAYIFPVIPHPVQLVQTAQGYL